MFCFNNVLPPFIFNSQKFCSVKLRESFLITDRIEDKKTEEIKFYTKTTLRESTFLENEKGKMEKMNCENYKTIFILIYILR